MPLVSRPRPGVAPAAARAGSRRPLLVVAALAVLLRVVLMVASGGWHSAVEYDDGVHYGSAVMLLQGHLPYRDQTFLQPPGITLLLLPFAAAGRAVGQEWGLALARLATCVVGGVVTYRLGVLVAAGRSVWRGAAAGVVYATAASTVVAGSTVLLEPWLSLFLVAGWSVLLRSRDPDGPAADRHERDVRLAGVLLGLATMVKAWGAVAAGAAAVWLVASGRRRDAWRLAAAAAATAAVVLGPFLLAAPSATVRDVVTAQLGRPPSGVQGLWSRLVAMTGAPWVRVGEGEVRSVFAVCAVAVVVVLAVLARRDPLGRLAGLSLGGAVAMFALAGPYYLHYGEFVVLPVAVLAGVGLPEPPVLPAVLPAALAGLVALPLAGTIAAATPARVDVRALDRALRPAVGCVEADQPVLLELADRLGPGCPQWLDPRGSALASSGRLPRRFYPAGFRRLPRWQAQWRDRMRAADALVLTGAPCRHVEWTPATCGLVVRDFRYRATVGHAGPALVPVQVWLRVTERVP